MGNFGRNCAKSAGFGGDRPEVDTLSRNAPKSPRASHKSWTMVLLNRPTCGRLWAIPSEICQSLGVFDRSRHTSSKFCRICPTKFSTCRHPCRWAQAQILSVEHFRALDKVHRPMSKPGHMEGDKVWQVQQNLPSWWDSIDIGRTWLGSLPNWTTSYNTGIIGARIGKHLPFQLEA